MSTTTASEAPRRRPAGNAAWALPSRAVAAASGPVGLAIKLCFLAIVNAIALWAAIILAGKEKWVSLLVLVLATAAIDAVYLIPGRLVPLKFLIPGTVFLLAFQIAPIVYNINIAFTNWSTGHIVDQGRGDRRDPAQLARGGAGRRPVRDGAGTRGGRLARPDPVDEEASAGFVGTKEGLEEAPAGSVELDENSDLAAPEGYTLVPPDQLLALDRELAGYTVPVERPARSGRRASTRRSSCSRRCATTR